MTEIEREEILAQRLEEMQRIHDRRAIERMVKEQRSGTIGTADGDTISKAAKRACNTDSVASRFSESA